MRKLCYWWTAKKGRAWRSLHIPLTFPRSLNRLIAQLHLRDTGSPVLFSMAAEVHRLSELSQKGCVYHVPVPFLA